jgi:hypothetical protein
VRFFKHWKKAKRTHHGHRRNRPEICFGSAQKKAKSVEINLNKKQNTPNQHMDFTVKTPVD